MTLPKEHKRFNVNDPLVNLGTPGSSKPPLKLSTKSSIKVISKGAVDKSSPQKGDGEPNKILRMKVARGSSSQLTA